jgi:hypothetical protein
MPHPLVAQLRFARSEFVRGLDGLTNDDAVKRMLPMNSISWMIGHMAWQEQRYWLYRAQGQMPYPDINTQMAYGAPACTPPLEEVWTAWRAITAAADPWLDAVTNESIMVPLLAGDSSIGTYLLRNIYHYWYHLGEAMAARQVLGHTGLPDFVGDIDGLAPYRPEASV